METEAISGRDSLRGGVTSLLKCSFILRVGMKGRLVLFSSGDLQVNPNSCPWQFTEFPVLPEVDVIVGPIVALSHEISDELSVCDDIGNAVSVP